MVSRAGLEPATHWLKPVALPTELSAHIKRMNGILHNAYSKVQRATFRALYFELSALSFVLWLILQPSSEGGVVDDDCLGALGAG